MAHTLQFEQLLQSVAPEDTGKLKAELEDLQAEEEATQEKLAEVRGLIREVESTLATPIRSAIKAARELGIDVPEEYQQVTTGPGNRSAGKYIWHAEGLEPKQSEPSRAMWRLSKGSSGTASRNGEGVLKAGEFWALVEEQTGKTEADLEVGDSIDVTLPNGRELRVEKIEG